MILGVHTKQPGETYKLGVDFGRRLQAGETLNGQTVTSKKVSDGSDSTATIISEPGTSGTKVEARVSAGVANDDHIVQFHATTSLGNVFEDEITLRIRES